MTDEQAFERLINGNKDERARIIRSMTFEQLMRLDGKFELWAHKSQLPPSGEGWRIWLMLAGRGFGKTRAGAEWVHGGRKVEARRADRAGRGEHRRCADDHGRRGQRRC